MGRRKRRRRLKFTNPNLFETPHWTRLLQPGRHAEEEPDILVRKLLLSYALAPYAYFRQEGRTAGDAALTAQTRLNALLHDPPHSLADREQGRLREFLFEEVVRTNREEIGTSPTAWIRLDTNQIEADFQALHLSPEAAPDTAYLRGWAYALLKRVYLLLEEDYRRARKERFFEQMKEFLPGHGPAPDYAEVAKAFDLTPYEIKIEVNMAKRLFRELLRVQVESSLCNPAFTIEETHLLIEAIRDRQQVF